MRATTVNETGADVQVIARSAGVQVIARSAGVLRALAGRPRGMSLTEIADAVALPRSTAHRILGALVAEELVMAADCDGQYRLGPEILRLASSDSADLRGHIRPFLEALSDASRETVCLSVLAGDQTYFIDQVVWAANRLQAVVRVGERLPAWGNAAGKALLSNLDDDQVRRLLPRELPAVTAHAITDVDVLLGQLAEIRRTGIAYAAEEQTEGICALAVPVGRGVGWPAAIGIPMPAQRYYREQDGFFRELLLDAATEIDRALAATHPAQAGVPSPVGAYS